MVDRAKDRLLGPPLNTEDLAHERLGRPTALAVFASDNLSSSAYATEEILRVLVPAVGLAAFSLVVPLTVAMLVVLAFLILSYRQTIKAYPSAGGAYVVTRDNFGIVPAQFAGVSLLTDYVLTVAVSVSAGTAALTSAFPALVPASVPISVAFILLVAYGNLRGVKESGKVFAVPTYFFIVNMLILLGVGLVRMFAGGLPTQTLGHEGLVHLGTKDPTLFLGAGLFVILHAFASGGTAVTGVEAISNGVPAFRAPEWKNARSTLVVMGASLGVMFLGLSVLAGRMHVVPFAEGSPTVISQVGRLVYGGGAVGHVLFFALQAGTMLILVLAANTSFADFPRLASFQAADGFLPRRLVHRGHRLVFSSGILWLSAASIVLVIVTRAKVDHLIPLYAVGVFTSFTLSQAGMTRHHLRHREAGWRAGLVINGVGAALSGLVLAVITITKFMHGAWVIVVLVPVSVVLLLRLNRQYRAEATELEHDARLAATVPILRRHVVLVLVERLDRSTARALQYARTLAPDELRAVHIASDLDRSEELADEWARLGLSRLTLELVDCPDRRLPQTLVEVVSEVLAGGDTEVSVLLPRRCYRRLWHRLLHDRTAERLAGAVAGLPHANVTFVPYHLGQ
jgi:amino acid transporter